MSLWPTIIIAVLVGLAASLLTIGVVWWGLLLPRLESLLMRFSEKPGAFAVLDKIVEQLLTHDGSSLRDAVDRLEVAAGVNRIKVDENTATGRRMEMAQGLVKDDLDAAHKRADEVGEGEPGAAADAAAQTVK